MYKLIRQVLFSFPPEISHKLALNSLKLMQQLGWSQTLAANPVQLFGITFPNRIGFAAGLDKNGDYIDGLAALGVGFIELGTVTPRAQVGNPPPRLFRLTEDEALINRLGFNNKGVAHLIAQIKKRHSSCILGINIGKNYDTSLADAMNDYIFCFKECAAYAHYVTVNISSPNTKELRTLQQPDFLIPLLTTLKNEQQIFFNTTKKYVPLVVKISPDLSAFDIKNIAKILLEKNIDGVIATNTTISRENLRSKNANETGGLSGLPLHARSTSVIKILKEVLQDQLPIIASGGIMNAKIANEKLAAGALLLQIYTGFIYNGPRLLRDLSAINIPPE